MRYRSWKRNPEPPLDPPECDEWECGCDPDDDCGCKPWTPTAAELAEMRYDADREGR